MGLARVGVGEGGVTFVDYQAELVTLLLERDWANCLRAQCRVNMRLQVQVPPRPAVPERYCLKIGTEK